MSQNFNAETLGFSLSLFYPQEASGLYNSEGNSFVYLEDPDMVKIFPCFGILQEGYGSAGGLVDDIMPEERGFFAPLELVIPEETKILLDRGNGGVMQFRTRIDKSWRGNGGDMHRRIFLIPAEAQ